MPKKQRRERAGLKRGTTHPPKEATDRRRETDRECLCTDVVRKGWRVQRKPQRREQLLLFPWRQSPVGSG